MEPIIFTMFCKSTFDHFHPTNNKITFSIQFSIINLHSLLEQNIEYCVK